ncbi:MAG TPA: hypothetical protein VNC61_16895 [Acidimicrobiales bacterium]|nr:hypothetical protein [Acidimicrobiales bacterium]
MRSSKRVRPVARRSVVPLLAVASVVVLTPDVVHADTLPAAPGCPVLPAADVWHAPVSTLRVDPSSATYVASIGASSPLHPDVGSGKYHGQPIGIADNVVRHLRPPFLSGSGTRRRVIPVRTRFRRRL